MTVLKNRDTEEKREVLDNLTELGENLRLARRRFNEATEPELVDACVFELNALQARYNYFLRLARENGFETAYQARA